MASVLDAEVARLSLAAAGFWLSGCGEAVVAPTHHAGLQTGELALE